MTRHSLLFNCFHPICEYVFRPILHRIGYDFEVREWTKSCKDPYKALEPYIETIKNFKCPPQKGETGKIIWQFWWQGEDSAPPIVKSCLQSVKRFAGDFKVIVVTQNNLSAYIAIPKHIQKKHDAGIISHTHFSDYVRVCLLEKYGGIWIDATVYLTGPIPQDILDAKFFFYRSTGWTINNRLPTSELFPAACQIYSILGGGLSAGSNWFLAAKVNSAFPHLLRMLLERYWRESNGIGDYYLFHHLMTLSIVHNHICNREFVAMPNYDNIKPHLLQFSLDRPFEALISQRIKSLTTIHKLTYKFDCECFWQNSFYAKLLSNDL